jgi:hypothetical protein
MEFHKFCAAEFLRVLLYEGQTISNSIYPYHKEENLALCGLCVEINSKFCEAEFISLSIKRNY